jgi:hypothetical protein
MYSCFLVQVLTPKNSLLNYLFFECKCRFLNNKKLIFIKISLLVG